MNKTSDINIILNAKKLLESVPENEYILHSQTDLKSKCCAKGHYCRLTSANPDDYSYQNCWVFYETGEKKYGYYLCLLIAKFCAKVQKIDTDLALINDGGHPLYKQSSPKKRVMALFDDMINSNFFINENC